MTLAQPVTCHLQLSLRSPVQPEEQVQTMPMQPTPTLMALQLTQLLESSLQDRVLKPAKTKATTMMKTVKTKVRKMNKKKQD